MQSKQLLIGHFTQRDEWVTDTVVSHTALAAGVDYNLTLFIKGSSVRLTVANLAGTCSAMAIHAFNSIAVDGSHPTPHRQGGRRGRATLCGRQVKFASAHDLRRSFGERWAHRILPKELMEVMRHRSIETTMRYYVGRNAKKTASAMRAAYQKVSIQVSTTNQSNHERMKKAATPYEVTAY